MKRTSIGGTLTYEALARLHAPRTHTELRAACLELHARGYSDYSIARATLLAVEQVRRLLAERRERT